MPRILGDLPDAFASSSEKITASSTKAVDETARLITLIRRLTLTEALIGLYWLLRQSTIVGNPLEYRNSKLIAILFSVFLGLWFEFGFKKVMILTVVVATPIAG